MTMLVAAPHVTTGARTPNAPAEPAPPTQRRVDAERAVMDIVDIWGRDSFPASDAPANW